MTKLCIAIYKPVGAVVTDNQLEESCINNPDGFGFCYINTDHLGVKRMIIKKSMDQEVFMRQLRRAERTSPESPFLIHCRIRTHGETTVFNCHPFAIDDEHAFIHNGIIRGVRTDPRKSDTQIFNEDVLQRLPENWMFSDGVKTLIEEFIGYNKIVAMDIDGNVSIFNESKGEWKDDVWFSNSSYEPKVSYYNGRSNYGTGTANGTATSSWRDSNGVYNLPSNTDSKFTPESLCRCKGCASSTFFMKTLYHFYDSESGIVKSFCQSCKSRAAAARADLGREIGTQAALDYCNAAPQDAYQDYEIFTTEWNNPWSFGNESTEEEEDNYTDSLYDARYSLQ